MNLIEINDAIQKIVTMTTKADRLNIARIVILYILFATVIAEAIMILISVYRGEMCKSVNIIFWVAVLFIGMIATLCSISGKVRESADSSKKQLLEDIVNSENCSDVFVDNDKVSFTYTSDGVTTPVEYDIPISDKLQAYINVLIIRNYQKE
mgnify:CR=1 FL=1